MLHPMLSRYVLGFLLCVFLSFLIVACEKTQ